MCVCVCVSTQDVVTEAPRALTAAMKATAPHIMTWRQILAFLERWMQRKVAKARGLSPPPPYTPLFNEGVKHFLLHAGGAKVRGSSARSCAHITACTM